VDLSLDNAILKGRAVKHVCDLMSISERRACRAIGQPRSTQPHSQKIPDDEEHTARSSNWRADMEAWLLADHGAVAE
jgi:hypothetical protein